jgi:cytochrome c biogenesis factor
VIVPSRDPSGNPPEPHPGTPGETSRPPALVALLVGVGVEILVLVVAAVVVLVELLGGGSQSVGVSAFLVVFTLGVAAVLAASARGLLRGQRWARSPVATWQILQVVVTISSLQVGVTPWVVAGLVLAVAVLVLLMLRPVVEATTRDARPAA